VERRIEKSNRALKDIKLKIGSNSEVTKKYLEDVIKDVSNITKPNIADLRQVYNQYANLNLK
jgi:uncharacterized protein YpuA (DUF1002 family)